MIHFVCTGNICRSPLAEAMFRELVAARGLNLQVTSSGLFAVPGNTPPAQLLATASQEGLDLSAHRARLFQASAVGAEDLVLVMEELHTRQVLSRAKLDEEAVMVLGGFDVSGRGEIDDPYGGPDSAYSNCYAQLARSLEAFSDWLKQR